jgi:2-polyprenyl-3-methyl-5-hydroxy-6-metoxy-1,4-benzoquinol methylase
MTKLTNDETIMAEWNRQTKNDIDAMHGVETLFHGFSGSTLSKLDNFTRHVRRQCLSKFLARSEIFNQILDVHGSILDLGVSAGQSLFTWAQLSSIREPLNYTRKIIGFDTFEGIPGISEQDLQSPSPSSHLKAGGFKFEHLDQLELAKAQFDLNRSLGHIEKIEMIKGDICKTLPKYLEENGHLVVSLLHIDVDVYEATKVALDHVVKLMPKGAIIVFDEVNQVPYPGETRAVVDSIGLNNIRLKRFSWETGISYCVLE